MYKIASLVLSFELKVVSNICIVILHRVHRHLNGGGLRLLAITLMPEITYLLYIYNPQQMAMPLWTLLLFGSSG